MKNRVIVSTIYILIGILICLIPTYLYPVCNGEMKMACYYTKQAEIGLGILITLLGIVFIAAKNENIRIKPTIKLISPGAGGHRGHHGHRPLHHLSVPGEDRPGDLGVADHLRRGAAEPPPLGERTGPGALGRRGPPGPHGVKDPRGPAPGPQGQLEASAPPDEKRHPAQRQAGGPHHPGEDRGRHRPGGRAPGVLRHQRGGGAGAGHALGGG